MREFSGKFCKQHGVLAVLALAALLLRAIIPLGYMPGNVLAGEFVVLCPTGSAAKFAAALHGEHHAESGQHLDMDADCPIGTALQAAALPTAVVDHSIEFAGPVHNAVEATAPPAARHLRLYLIRGPPQV